jgi:hypothetical protein
MTSPRSWPRLACPSGPSLTFSTSATRLFPEIEPLQMQDLTRQSVRTGEFLQRMSAGLGYRGIAGA